MSAHARFTGRPAVGGAVERRVRRATVLAARAPGTSAGSTIVAKRDDLM